MPDRVLSLSDKNILLLAGDQDPLIPYDSAVALADFYRRAGAKVWFKTMPTGHGLIPEDVLEARQWYDQLNRMKRMKLRPSSLAWTLCLCGAAALLIGILAQPEAPVSRQTAVATAGTMGGDFTLVDQNGHIVTNKSWPGQYQFIVFRFYPLPGCLSVGPQ